MRVVIVSVVVAGLVVPACAPPPLPTPPADSFAFAVLGDAPYYWWEENQFRRVLQQIDEADLAMVVHVGDIFWRPCSDTMMLRRKAQFDAMRHPLIYTPGDNEWADCWERRVGGYRPRERLDRLRQIYFSDPSVSLGSRKISLTTQAGRGEFPEFVENARWSHDGVLFTTVHLVGSENFRQPFTSRTAADNTESTRRTAAAAAWLTESFVEATTNGSRAVVVAFHANPGFSLPPDNAYRQAFDPFLLVLENEVASFAGPVLVVQGDNHDYLVDSPLRQRATGVRLANVTRMQVPGSPEVGWIRVTVSRDAAHPFEFEKHSIPRWRIW